MQNIGAPNVPAAFAGHHHDALCAAAITRHNIGIAIAIEVDQSCLLRTAADIGNLDRREEGAVADTLGKPQGVVASRNQIELAIAIQIACSASV